MPDMALWLVGHAVDQPLSRGVGHQQDRKSGGRMMKLPWRVIVPAALGLAILAALALTVPQMIAPESRAVALADLPQLYPAQSKSLGKVVIETYREYRANAARWSGVYFTCVFGAAFLSALAGLVLKLELLQAWPRFRNDFAATAAMLAALLVTLSASGDFQRKWQANRIAAAAMENLAYELITPKNAAELDAVVAEIQAVNDARNKGIVGEQATVHPGERPRSPLGRPVGGAADEPPAARGASSPQTAGR